MYSHERNSNIYPVRLYPSPSTKKHSPAFLFPQSNKFCGSVLMLCCLEYLLLPFYATVSLTYERSLFICIF